MYIYFNYVLNVDRYCSLDTLNIKHKLQRSVFSCALNIGEDILSRTRRGINKIITVSLPFYRCDNDVNISI